MVNSLIQGTERLNLQYQQYKSNEHKGADMAALVSAESKLSDGSIEVTDRSSLRVTLVGLHLHKQWQDK